MATTSGGLVAPLLVGLPVPRQQFVQLAGGVPTVEWLSKYAPELNHGETVWRDLKAHHLAHQTFADPNALDHAIHRAVDEVNQKRPTLPLAKLRTPA